MWNSIYLLEELFLQVFAIYGKRKTLKLKTKVSRIYSLCKMNGKIYLHRIMIIDFFVI